MPRGKGQSDIDDLFGDLLGDDIGDDLGGSGSPSPPVPRKGKGKKVDVYDDAFYEQLAQESGIRNSNDDDDQPPNPQDLKQTMDSINFDDLDSDLFGSKKEDRRSPTISRKSRGADPLVGRSPAARGRLDVGEQKNVAKVNGKEDQRRGASDSPDLDAMDDALFNSGKVKERPAPSQQPQLPLARKTPNEKGDGVQSRQNLSGTAAANLKPPKVDDDDDLGDLDDLLNSDDEGAKKGKTPSSAGNGAVTTKKWDFGGENEGSGPSGLGGLNFDDPQPSTSNRKATSSEKGKRPPINFDDDDDDDPDGMNFLNSLMKSDKPNGRTEVKDPLPDSSSPLPPPSAPNSRPPPSPQRHSSRPSSPEKDLFDTSGDADILGDLLPGDDRVDIAGPSKRSDPNQARKKSPVADDTTGGDAFGGDFMASLMGGKKDTAASKPSAGKSFDFDLDDKYKSMADGAGKSAKQKEAETGDDFVFGGYAPSATEKPTSTTASPKKTLASSHSPRQKNVSLSKEDDDFIFGGYAPSASAQPASSPSKKKTAINDSLFKADDDDWLADLKNSRNRGGAKSPGNAATARKATADWLGLDESELASPSRPKTPLSSRTSSPIKMDPDFEKAMYGGRSSPTRRQTAESPIVGGHASHSTPSRQPRSRQSSTRSAAAEAILGLGGEVEIEDDPPPPPLKGVRKKRTSEIAAATPVAITYDSHVGEDAATNELKRLIEKQQLEMQKNQAALEAELKRKQMEELMKRQELQLQQQREMQQRQLAAITAASTSASFHATAGFSVGEEAARNKELEKKVFKLELEKENLEARLELITSRHQMEMEELTEFHRRKESRKDEEREDRCEELKRKIAALEEARDRAIQDKADALLEWERRRVDEVRALNEAHLKANEEMQRHHEEVVAHLKKSKMAELDAALATHDNAQNLNNFVAKLSNNTSDLNALAGKVEAEHQRALNLKEAALTEKDEQLQQLHSKLHQLSTDSEKERKQLQSVLSKMEKHLSTTTDELNQERWNLAREKSRVDALQASLEEERKGASEKSAIDWTNLHKAKESLLAEQKQLVTDLQRERAALHEERLRVAADQDALQRGAMAMREKAEDKMRECALQREALDEMKGELELRERQVKRQEESLEEESRRLEEGMAELEAERSNLRRLAESLKGKSEELEEEMERSVNAYEAGVSALNEARKIEEEQKARLFQIENQVERNRVLQKELAEERLILARERVGDKGRGKMTSSKNIAPSASGVSGVVSSTNLSVGEVVPTSIEGEEERTISDIVDSFLVNQTTTSQTLRETPHRNPRTDATADTPTQSLTQRPPAAHDRFSNVFGAALGRGLGDHSSDDVLLSSFGLFDDASTTEAVTLLIQGQRENEYLKEEQKFLARLRLTNKKR